MDHELNYSFYAIQLILSDDLNVSIVHKIVVR